MHWLTFFIYSWIIFFIFVDWSKFNRSIYGGLLALWLGALVDWAGHYLNLYHFNHTNFGSLANSVLYAAGPLFTMGVLFFQYVSLSHRLQMANVAVFSLAYFAAELLIVKSGAASYIHWHYLASLGVDITVFTAMSYAGEIIMYRKLTVKMREGGGQ